MRCRRGSAFLSGLAVQPTAGIQGSGGAVGDGGGDLTVGLGAAVSGGENTGGCGRASLACGDIALLIQCRNGDKGLSLIHI